MFNFKSFFSRKPKPTNAEMIEAVFELFTEEELAEIRDPEDFDVKDFLFQMIEDMKPRPIHSNLEEAKDSMRSLIEMTRKRNGFKNLSISSKIALKDVIFRALFYEK